MRPSQFRTRRAVAFSSGSRNGRRVKIAILGATRGTGAEAVKIALERGHDVLAFARSPDKLTLSSAKLTKLAGDFHQRDSVRAAVAGQDAVLITASATSLKGFKENPNYFSLGTGYALDAMKQQGTGRVIVLSALGTGDSRKLVPWPLRTLLTSFLLKAPFADHERQEQLVRGSGVPWVIARPGRLTDGPGRKKYLATNKIEPVPSAISRADVADFLVTAAESDTWLGQTVQLGG
jgi:uncharacterized protein YbjT (DUF2867 family)